MISRSLLINCPLKRGGGEERGCSFYSVGLDLLCNNYINLADHNVVY